jgi:hypothetical protein
LYEFSRLSRATALVLILAMAAGCAHATSSGSSAAIAPAPDSSAAPGDIANAYADVAVSIPADRYDLDLRTTELAAGVAPAFALARDEIRAESYSGSLQGAAGAYQSRGANSIDRSLLLAQILKTKGIDARFASCKLDANSAETLATALFAAPPAQAPVAASSPNPDGLTARIFARANRDLTALRAALGTTTGLGSGLSHADLIAELQDHTWVQAQVNGTWTDLDPSFPDAVAGKAYCTPDATTADIPQTEQQTITIRVGTETLTAGTLSQSVVLEKSFPAATLLGRQIYLANAPAGDTSGLGDKSTYVPQLAVSGTSFGGKPIRFADGAASPGALAGQTSAIGAIPDGSQSPSAAPSSTPNAGPFLVAEWLELAVAFPNGKTDTTRRFLFDRGGMAWRASAAHDSNALAPLASDANGPLAAQSIFQIDVSAGGHDLRAYQAALAVATAAAPAASGTIYDVLWPLAIHDFAFAIESDARVVPSLEDRPGVRFYADSPRIFVFETAPAPDGKSGTYLATDLRRDTIRGVARDAGTASAVADGLLRFGAMEGALEEEIAEPPSDLRQNGSSFGATSDLLGSDGITVFHPGADLASVKDPETAARMRAALATGATLAVPSNVLAGGPSGWWEVTGDGTRVRSVFGEDLDASIGVVLGGTGAKQVGTSGGGSLRFTINPDYTSFAEQNGKPVDLGGFSRAKAPPVGGAGGEGGEELTTLQVALIVMAPLAASGAILAWFFIVRKPQLDAIAAGASPP